ncbi:MAG: universal stress protein [Clostridia bacterium]|nr:universal stress protein [Clostridia bacterium]
MYQKILVPLDGSAKAEKALLQAINLAKLTQGSITLLHVISELSPYLNDGLGGAYQQVYQDLQVTGENILEKVQQKYVSEGVVLEGKIVWGNAAEEVCKEAEDNNYDLIIMGSRGLSEVKGFIMGSVSNRVVRHAVCPVLIVR